MTPSGFFNDFFLESLQEFQSKGLSIVQKFVGSTHGEMSINSLSHFCRNNSRIVCIKFLSKCLIFHVVYDNCWNYKEFLASLNICVSRSLLEQFLLIIGKFEQYVFFQNFLDVFSIKFWTKSILWDILEALNKMWPAPKKKSFAKFKVDLKIWIFL